MVKNQMKNWQFSIVYFKLILCSCKAFKKNQLTYRYIFILNIFSNDIILFKIIISVL